MSVAKDRVRRAGRGPRALVSACAALSALPLLAGGLLLATSGPAAAVDSDWVQQTVPATSFAAAGTPSPVSCVAGTTFCVVIERDSIVPRTNFPSGDAALVTTDGSVWKLYPTLPLTTDPTWGVTTPSSVQWSAISCYSEKDCWIAGAGPTDEPEVANSTDGGQTWTLETPDLWANGGPTWWPNSIDCVTATTCWLAGQDADSVQDPVVAVTTDEGGAWSVMSTSADASESWVTAASLPSRVSNDPNGMYLLSGISCVSVLSCVAVGGINESDGTAAVISTTDGGASWSLSPDPALVGIQQLMSVSCVAQSSAIALCEAVGSALTSGPVTLTSSDGGTTWSGEEFLHGAGWLSSISCADAGNCWTAGAGTTLSLAGTNDGGQTWLPTGGNTSNQEGSVSCASSVFCAATSVGALFVTTDDGGLTPALATQGKARPAISMTQPVTKRLPVVTPKAATARSGDPYTVVGKDFSPLAAPGDTVTLRISSPSGPASVAVTKLQLNDFYEYRIKALHAGATTVTGSVAQARTATTIKLSSVVVRGYADAAPGVVSVKPSAGPIRGGQKVTITGTNLSGATSVEFGARAGTRVRVISSHTMTVTAPRGSDTVPVTVVTSRGGTSAIAAAARYTYATGPILRRVTPAKGSAKGGNTVVLQGTGLVWALQVKFGTHLASHIRVLSADAISVRVPAGAGKVSVVVTASGGTSARTRSSVYSY